MFPAGVREAEGPHADPCVQPGEDQSGWSPHMLLCAHQQEGQHLSALTRGSNGHQEEPVSDHQGSRGLAKLSLYLEEGFVVAEEKRNILKIVLKGLKRCVNSSVDTTISVRLPSSL